MNIVQRHRTANPYEKQFGYCRAVKRGPFIAVSGTTAIDLATGQVAHPTSAYLQALTVFREIIAATEALGGRKSDIIRVRMFVTYDDDSSAVGQALKEEMGDVEPAATMILGAKFVSPHMRVEIEADAISST